MNSLSRAERILFLAMLLAAATLLLVGCAKGGGAAVFTGAVAPRYLPSLVCFVHPSVRPYRLT